MISLLADSTVALQPACQLSLRTRRPSSYDDDNEEWVNVGSDGEAGEEDNPIQTVR